MLLKEVGNMRSLSVSDGQNKLLLMNKLKEEKKPFFIDHRAIGGVVYNPSMKIWNYVPLLLK
jgi:hypothetical protein